MLSNYPALRPSLLLDFINHQAVDPRVTFTRHSRATAFDARGQLRTFDANAPRIDYDPATLACRGLLIEEARTNQILQSEDFSTTWALSTGNPTITTNAIVAPDGTLTADKLVEGTSNGLQNVLQANVSFASGTNAYSVFAKAGERYKITLNESTTLGAAVLFDLSAGTVLSSTGGGSPAPSGLIQAVGNGWYRCTMLLTQASTANRTARIYVVDDATTTASNSILSRTGDGTSGVYIWGAQLESGAFPTSYIPTTTAAVTRSADVASMTGANFSSWFNATEGVLCTDYAPAATAVTLGAAALSDGTNNNRMIVRGMTTTSTTTFLGVAGGVTQWNDGFSAATVTPTKTALAYLQNNIAFTRNAASPITDVSATIPTVDRLRIGADGDGSNVFCGHIRRIAYYPRRLTNAELLAITA